MSTDYYTRLEQGRGPQPSEQMVGSLAQGLRLTLDERDHVYRLAGYSPPARDAASDFIAPGLLRVLDRLQDTPAEIVTELGETLKQNDLGVALTGNLTRFEGPARSIGFRWFTNPASRSRYEVADHAMLSRVFAAGLREVVALRGPDSRAAMYVDLLLDRSDEFREVWSAYEVGIRPERAKRFVHPVVGPLDLECQSLLDPDQSHRLLVYTAVPGSASYDKLLQLASPAAPLPTDHSRISQNPD